MTNLGCRIYWKDVFACNLVGYPLSIRKVSSSDNGSDEQIIAHCLNEDNQVAERVIHRPES